MILNGKGCLTGCGPHGYSLVSMLFLTGQSSIPGFPFLLVSSVCLFVRFVASVYYSWAVEEKWRTTSS